MRNLSLSALMACLLAVTYPAAAAFLPAKTGEQTRYNLTYQGDGTVSIQGMLDRKNTFADHIQTQLSAQLEVVQVSPLLFSVRLRSPDHRLQIDGQTRDLKRQIDTLEHWCYLTVDLQGRVQSVCFAAGTPSVARSLMRSLVSGLQFVRMHTAAFTWKCDQDTANGTAHVSYRSIGGDTVEKSIVDYPYQRKIGPKGMPQMRPVTRGALDFTFRQGHLQEVKGAFSTSFTLADKTLSDGSERFELKRVGSEIESAANLRRLQTDFRLQSAIEHPTELHVHDTDAAAQRASWATLLKGATLASMFANLADVDAKGVRNDSELYSRLCALMTLHPETCAGFERMLDSAQPNKLSTRLVVAALAGVAGGPQQSSLPNTKAMQAAELSLYGALASHQDQPDTVLLLAPAIGMTTVPDRDVEHLLESLVESKDHDIAISCALALGSLAHNGSIDTTRRCVEHLVRKLATAHTWFQEQLLAALGNAGSADGLKSISAFSKNTSPQLRATAMMSLRLVPGRQATDLLYRGLHDADANVRFSAARAFEFRPFSLVDIQEFRGMISAEKIDRVRQALLENLKLEAPYYPEARNVLAQASKQDSSLDIRRTVASWL